MITQSEVISIMQDAVFTIIVSSAPMLISGLLVGLLVSVFQATTQINEQTLAFVPKIVTILLSLLLFGGWIMGNLTGFIERLYQLINKI